MNIKAFEEDIKKCRFCFMCRHLSGVGNVTFREADGPRIRASLCWGAILDETKLDDPDFIATIYSSDLSAAGRFHCVNHYDEAGIVLAARRDIVARGTAPEDVKKIAARLMAAYVKARLNAPKALLAVASPYTRNTLAKAKINVKTLTEFAAEAL